VPDIPCTIEHIKACVSSRRYVVRRHAVDESFKYDVSNEDREHAVLSGRIIESYLDGSCLVLGTTASRLPLHIVVACEPTLIRIVTNYVPDRRYWEGDWATRRRPHYDG
jgi:hypothetical protein